MTAPPEPTPREKLYRDVLKGVENMPHVPSQMPPEFLLTTMERENLGRLRQAFSYSPATASLPAREPARCPYCEERELRARARLLGIWLPPMEG